jgi:hypothetical protein
MGWHGWHVGGTDGGGVYAGRSHGYVNHGLVRERGGSVHGQMTGPNGRLGMQGDHGIRGEREMRGEHTMRGGPERHSQAGGVKNLQNNATGMRGNTMNPGGSRVHGGPAGSMGARGGAGAGVSAHGGAAGPGSAAGAGEYH